MSFSSEVKLEIIENKPLWKHCGNAIAYGLFLCCQSFNKDKISLSTSQKEVIDQFQKLGKLVLEHEIQTEITELQKGEIIYQIKIENGKDRRDLVAYFSNQSNVILDTEEKKYAFLAGAFLSCGNITDPKKSYHMEFVTASQEISEKLVEVLRISLPKLRTMTRRNKLIVYCKDSAQIIDALTMMGANKATFQLIEVEMIKGIRNNANRVTNCETANIDKTVMASTSQVEDIKLVIDVKGENGISESQLETAKIRLENPYSSLRELTELFNPPISRSGLHHRLSAFSKQAAIIRKNQKEGENV